MNSFSFSRMLSLLRAMLSVRWVQILLLPLGLGLVVLVQWKSVDADIIYVYVQFFCFTSISSWGGKSNLLFSLPVPMAEKFAVFVCLAFLSVGSMACCVAGQSLLLEYLGMREDGYYIAWQLVLLAAASVPLLAVVQHYYSSIVLGLVFCLVLFVSLYVVGPFYFTFGGYVVEVEWIGGEWGKAIASIVASVAMLRLAYRMYRVLPASGNYVSFYRL